MRKRSNVLWSVTAVGLVSVTGSVGSGLVTAGCTGVDYTPNDEPCKQIGYSIASRTAACTGDRELANERYRRFDATYTCLVTDPTQETFNCAVFVGDLTCEQIEALGLGDDPDPWLLASRECTTVVARKDGQPVCQKLDPGMRSNTYCWRMVQYVENAVEKALCWNDGTIAEDRAAQIAEELQANFHCNVVPGTVADDLKDKCDDETHATLCFSNAGPVEEQEQMARGAAAWLAEYPSCAKLVAVGPASSVPETTICPEGTEPPDAGGVE